MSIDDCIVFTKRVLLYLNIPNRSPRCKCLLLAYVINQTQVLLYFLFPAIFVWNSLLQICHQPILPRNIEFNIAKISLKSDYIFQLSIRETCVLRETKFKTVFVQK